MSLTADRECGIPQTAPIKTSLTLTMTNSGPMWNTGLRFPHSYIYANANPEMD